MLKKIRITLATVAGLALMLLFLDFTGTLHAYLGWLAKIQLVPAILALNVFVVIALIALTLLFGRIYCSVICPLGIMQDVLAKFNRKKNRFSYSPAKTVLRYVFLAAFVVILLAGFGSIASILEPYSTFGLIVQNILQPLYISINNLLATAAEHFESYAFYEREVWLRSLPTLIIAVVLFLGISILAIVGGRTYCNTICPVGTVLGLLSKYARLKVVINEDKCKNCGKCAKNCKASCIDVKNHKIDYSRCVVCGNCLENCSFGAFAYGHKPTIDKENKVAAEYEAKKYAESDKTAGNANKNTDKTVDNGRRAFLVGTGVAMATAALAQDKKKFDGGLAVIEDKVAPKRHTQITPPGSLSAQNMAKRCTACQLCVSQCPNDVLRPSTDLTTLMQPVMSFERGYCRPECNRCAEVCPTGAIKPITLAEKSSTQVGHAVWVRKNCKSASGEATCDNCARHCPTGAIQMVHIDGDENKPMIPAINEARCIGCGACENLCPSRPFSAIYVEGYEVQRVN